MEEAREEELKAIIGCELVDELRSEWGYETNDEETQQWRDDLTPYEKELVKIWDNKYFALVIRVAETIVGKRS